MVKPRSLGHAPTRATGLKSWAAKLTASRRRTDWQDRKARLGAASGTGGQMRLRQLPPSSGQCAGKCASVGRSRSWRTEAPREDSASHVYEEAHRVDVVRVSRSRLFRVRREDRRDHQADTSDTQQKCAEPSDDWTGADASQSQQQHQIAAAQGEECGRHNPSVPADSVVTDHVTSRG